MERYVYLQHRRFMTLVHAHGVPAVLHSCGPVSYTHLVLAKVETTQRDAIEKTAEEIARRLAEGAVWHLLDTGHMLMFEGVGRTGGMMAVRPIKITCEIENPVRYRPGASSGAVGYDSISGFADRCV